MRPNSIRSALAAIAVLPATAALPQDDDLTASDRLSLEDTAVLPNAPLADLGGFAAVLHGLAEEMTAAAEHLQAEGERHRATEALDRALHLAEFGSHAYGLGPSGAEPFHRALDAIQAARHALQNGRPEDAAEILDSAGQALGQADLEAASPAPITEHAEEVIGLEVLNQHGHHLGELEGFEEAERGPMAIVAHGGFLWWGENRESLPAESLLASEGFVVLPSPVEPEDFGKHELVRAE